MTTKAIGIFLRVPPFTSIGKESNEAYEKRDQSDEGLAHDIDQWVEAKPHKADTADRPEECGARDVPAQEIAGPHAKHLEDTADEVCAARAFEGTIGKVLRGDGNCCRIVVKEDWQDDHEDGEEACRSVDSVR